MDRLTELSLLAARLLLATVFLFAGTAKFFDPVGSRKALREFGLPVWLTTPLVVLLPLAELAVAAALIPVALAWYGAWGALVLLSAFLMVMGIAILRGRRPDCHCFGQLKPAPIGWTSLVRNILLGLCAAWLIVSGRGHAGPVLWTWLSDLDAFESKVAVVVGCVVAFLFLRVLLSARQKPAPEQPIEEVSLSSIFGEDEDEAEQEAAPPVRSRPAPPPPIRTAEPEPAGPLDIGLPIGTPAPEFSLPGVDGEMRSLESLRAAGNDVLLIFSSPFCKSCEALAANLGRWTLGRTGLPNITVVSRGAAKENLSKLKGLAPAQLLLQRESEVAHAYDCSSTPSGVLIGADGLIKSQLVIGGPAIRNLLLASAKPEDPGAAKTKAAQRASVFGG